MPLKSFQERLDSLDEGQEPSILLANGFSQAWDRDIFNYQNLFTEAQFGARDAQLRDIFNRFETYDFEQVMRSLEAAEIVGDAYGVDRAKLDEIRSDQEQLKDALIDVISRTHPARSSRVTTAQFESAKSFINQFDNIFTLNYDLLLYWIFTLNYDLLLYWIVNKNDIEPFGYITDDGFRGPEWENTDEQDVYFLHGGLHLYDSGSAIKKHTFRAATDTSIVDQVRNNLDNGKFPLFVSEPSHEKKLHKIEHNPYLNAGYKALKQLDGVLFIHGHSMDENDKHIFDQIKVSNVSKVFVSIFGDKDSPANTRTRANAKAFIERPGLEVKFYDAATAPIW
ncbi:DUF4917 family protein [Vibrio anguillarum]|nr:DUF4917 family protein [Vibrio anguillarum]MBT2915243.1 DUF4917 family protein [Vibrio anguillarum]OQQ08278.1 DUF4917 domain-containing protein [Vibrio anguillarum]